MTDALSHRVAATVRAELARHRVEQRQVSELLGVSQTQVSRRLSGRVPFRIDELQQIADLLHVPVGALVAERGETPASVPS